MSFSNLLPKEVSAAELETGIRAAIAMLKRFGFAPTQERLILPPDWETSLHPELVAEIKRRT